MRERIARATLSLLASSLVFAPSAAHARLKLFTAEWYTNSFGNFCRGNGTTGPHCTKTTGFFQEYSNWNLPQNQNCNPNQPRCPFQSTPVSSKGDFAPLGGSQVIGQFCAPWSNWNGGSFSVRPAKGQTITSGPPPTGMSRPVPPLYRNPNNFTTATPSASPRTTQCTEMSTGFTTQNKGFWGNNKGRVHIGDPIDGTWNAGTTGGGHLGGFTIPVAPPHNHKFGLEQSGIQGSFTIIYPYIYSYTYATLRNDKGVFGPGKGPGSFNLIYSTGMGTVASITVKQGPAKFGGTMKMLGALTSKACYYFQGGCLLYSPNRRYEAIGAAAYTSGGVVTRGYRVLGPPSASHICYHTSYATCPSTSVSGSRFPWTTGSVTVAATGRGPGDTVHYAHGYDNRNTTTSSGKGTIQLVSPILTRWLGSKTFETGGIATLRIKFLPEPQTWAMLVAGVSLLAVGYRLRGR
jgi:hypothetical protein